MQARYFLASRGGFRPEFARTGPQGRLNPGVQKPAALSELACHPEGMPKTPRCRTRRVGAAGPAAGPVAEPLRPHPHAAGKTLPEVLKVAEVAALLRCDRKTVYSLVQRGKLPGAKRIGRGIRVSKRAVLEWLASGESSR